MQHSFDVEIAQKCGILEAVLLENIYYWIKKNEVNNKHFYDGKYWTYNSRKAFAELFPYASEKQIRTALEKLIKNGLIITGNYNPDKRDRTLWYSLSDNGFLLFQKRLLQMTVESETLAQEGEPLPDNKPNILPPYIPPKGETKKNNAELIEQVIDYLNKKGGTSFRTTSKKTVQLINARIKQGYTLDDFKDVIWHCYCEWVQQPFKFSNGQMSDTYFRPSTLFSETNFENYLQEYRKSISSE